ncbi:DUF397 domain-containing protein [Plantactinospora sp. WMMB334]|uniref:DUF397 domain-containing protein n=1 Tax=Plantactinospora sp. WMMB334 TaxID=3404119 RepID=UPI003B94E3F0
MTGFEGAVWRKSTRSQNNGACLEVARVGDVIGVRDSKNPDGPVLVFTLREFDAFLDGAAKGEFNDLL